MPSEREIFFAGVDKRLEALAALDADWDTYEASPINPLAIEGTRNFLEALYERFSPDKLVQISPFYIVPTPSGGTQIEWHKQGIDLEIELDPYGILGYLHTKEGNYTEEDDVPFDTMIDKAYGYLK